MSEEQKQTQASGAPSPREGESRPGGRREGGPAGGRREAGPTGGPGGPGGARRGKRQYFRKKKVCKFCVEKMDFIDYRIDIPADHPSGAFWFHPHVHGISLNQVSSGLAGIISIGEVQDYIKRAPSVVRYITLKDMQDYFDAVVVADAMPYAKLFDASRSHAAFSDHDVLMLGARLSAYASLEAGPLAVVGQSKEARRAYRRFVNVSPSNRRAGFFRSEAQARAWLASQVKAGG